MPALEGTSTLSIMWTTPFVQATSAVVTVARRMPSAVEIVTVEPVLAATSWGVHVAHSVVRLTPVVGTCIVRRCD